MGNVHEDARVWKNKVKMMEMESGNGNVTSGLVINLLKCDFCSICANMRLKMAKAATGSGLISSAEVGTQRYDQTRRYITN